MYEIRLSTGRITRTIAPVPASSEWVSFVVEPNEVIVGPSNCGDTNGYLIRSGRPAAALPGLLANCDQALPGPRPDQVWVSK